MCHAQWARTLVRREKGFGFITNDEGEDVFLPAAALPDGVTTLRKGARVEFSVIDGRKGHRPWV